MNQKAIIGGLTALAVIVVAFLLVRGAGGQAYDITTEAGQTAVAARLEAGKPTACSFTYQEEEYIYDWEVYFAGERFRAEGTTTVDGEPMPSGIINDGEYFYMWQLIDGEMAGSKVSVDVADEGMASDLMGDVRDIDNWTNQADENATGECRSWSMQSSKFKPPSTIDFMDLDAEIESMLEEYDDSEIDDSYYEGLEDVDLCGICDSFTGTDAADCRITFGCTE